MSGIYDRFRNNPHDYYNGMLNSETTELLNSPSKETAEKFISKYFRNGAKGKVFDFQFRAKYARDGKHLHTASLYFLGVTLRTFVERHLEQHFEARIPDYNRWKDFLYTWFLTALYHDAGCVIENDVLPVGSCEHFKSLEYHLGKHGVTHNAYSYIQDLFRNIDMTHGGRLNHFKSRECFTFPEVLIRNYFFYRADSMNAVDHGILAGYLMFDRLINNYDQAWEDACKDACKDGRQVQYEDFTHRGLSWRIGHQIHFACIANSIIAHNVWYGLKEDESRYQTYGLDPIISSTAPKIRIDQWPLVYFLDVLDTIEPVKRFSKLTPLEIWNTLDISASEDAITITIIGDILKENEDYSKWIDVIYSMPDWLAIKIEPADKKQITDSITLTPVLEDN